MESKTGWVRVTGITIAVFFAAFLSRDVLFSIESIESFYNELPLVVRKLEQPTRWLMFCLLGLYLAHRIPPWRGIRELGLMAPFGTAVAFGIVITVPMWLPSLLTVSFAAELDWTDLLFGSLIYPLGEEILFRGYVFRQLHRRAGWNFWRAAILTSVVFGAAHLGQAAVHDQSLAGQMGTVAMLSVLSIVGAWVFTKWDDNLWILVSLHGFMNLWWSVFEMAENPLGGTGANLMRLGTVVLAIGLTIYRDRLPAILASKQKTELPAAA